MFYSKPDVTPLNLDLVELSGGGSFPCRFEGRTHDNKPVHIRYRNGWLTVTVGEADGDLFTDPNERQQIWTEILSQQIGWGADGRLLLAQACQIAGITILGQMPEVDEIERTNEGALDWSGHTTYFHRVAVVSEQGLNAWIVAVLDEFPNIRTFKNQLRSNKFELEFCQPVFDLARSGDSFSLGFLKSPQPKKSRIWHRKKSEGVDLKTFAFFAGAQVFNFPKNAKAGKVREIENMFTVAIPNIEFAKTLTLVISTSITADDIDRKNIFHEFTTFADRCFVNDAAVINVETRKMEEVWTRAWFSKDLMDWCRGGADRYLTKFSSDTSEKLLALGPNDRGI